MKPCVEDLKKEYIFLYLVRKEEANSFKSIWQEFN